LPGETTTGTDADSVAGPTANLTSVYQCQPQAKYLAYTITWGWRCGLPPPPPPQASKRAVIPKAQMKRHMSGFLYLALSTACGRSRAAGEAGGAQIVVYILHLVVACTVRGPQAIVRDERIGHHVIAHEFLFTPTD